MGILLFFAGIFIGVLAMSIMTIGKRKSTDESNVKIDESITSLVDEQHVHTA